MRRRCHNLVPGLRRRWGRRSTRRLIRPGRARRPSRPAFLTAARRTRPGLVVPPGPAAIGQGHRVWSARRQQLTPARCPLALRHGGFLRRERQHQRCLLRLQRGSSAASNSSNQPRGGAHLDPQLQRPGGEQRPGSGGIPLVRRSAVADVSSLVRVSRPLLSLSRLVEARFPANGAPRLAESCWCAGIGSCTTKEGVDFLVALREGGIS